jgi:hypothetical protein
VVKPTINLKEVKNIAAKKELNATLDFSLDINNFFFSKGNKELIRNNLRFFHCKYCTLIYERETKILLKKAFVRRKRE